MATDGKSEAKPEAKSEGTSEVKPEVKPEAKSEGKSEVKPEANTEGTREVKLEGKPIMLIGIDDSDHSFYALEWTLDRFFAPFGSNHPFQLIIVHARPLPTSVIGLAGPGAAEVLPHVELDLKKAATRVVENGKEICSKKSVKDVRVEVSEGDPRNVMCDAVEKHHATLLVMGSHGYGALKRAVLGSVSDFCVHHARCTVMIVKKPKAKQ